MKLIDILAALVGVTAVYQAESIRFIRRRWHVGAGEGAPLATA